MIYREYYDKNKKLIGIGTGSIGKKISQQEFLNQKSQIREKAQLVKWLFEEAIDLDVIKEEWRLEISSRAEKMKYFLNNFKEV